jgi:hypothetical protein
MHRVKEEVRFAGDMLQVGDALSRFPPGTLAAVAIGAVGWESGRPILDMAGLADAHIARTPRIPGGLSGHDHGDPVYVLGRAPELVLPGGIVTRLPATDQSELQLMERYRSWFISGELVLRHPDFRRRYRPADLMLADGWHVRIWVRQPL